MKEDNTVYSISRGYRSMTIYFGNISNQLVSTSKITPGDEMPRRERYEDFCGWLKSIDIDPPAYEPTKKEKQQYENEFKFVSKLLQETQDLPVDCAEIINQILDD